MADGVQVDFQPGPTAILFRDGGQLLGVEFHAAFGVFAICGICGRRFLVIAVVLERTAHLVGSFGCRFALGQEAVNPATARRLRRRRLTGMSRALGFALADGVRRAGTARRLAERETGETVGKLSIVCHVLHPLETIALPECAGRRCRRTAKPRHATGLSYSGHKYITGEMRGRFCANPADTGRRQAKRRLTLGDGGLSVRKKSHCTFARPGFVCGARIARFVHLWPKRAILARLRATWWTFSTIFCSWRAISSKNRTFMAYIPRRIVHLVQRRPK